MKVLEVEVHLNKNCYEVKKQTGVQKPQEVAKPSFEKSNFEGRFLNKNSCK
jgi:hypothetical protein